MQNSISEMQEMKFSGFWMRVIASLIDYIICVIVSFIPAFVFGFIGGMLTFVTENEVVYLIYGIVLYLLIAAASVGYYAGFHASKYQATPGKMLIGVKVVDVYGNRISFWRGVGRYFAMALSALILYIGFIMTAFHPQKRSLHDLIAGTYVIQKDETKSIHVENYAHAE